MNSRTEPHSEYSPHVSQADFTLDSSIEHGSSVWALSRDLNRLLLCPTGQFIFKVFLLFIKKSYSYRIYNVPCMDMIFT